MIAQHLLAVNWMITYRCPGKCSYCLTNSGPANIYHELSAEEKLRAIEILSSLGVRRISLMGGEPFTVRELPLIIQNAAWHGITVNITTSGFGCNPRIMQAVKEGVQYINVSLDGQENYNDLHRGAGSYQQAIATIHYARQMDIPVRLYGVLTTQNSHPDAIDWLFQTARDLDVMLIMFIFLSPVGRASDQWHLQVPSDQREAVVSRLHQASQTYGVRFKHCDPYLPEEFKVFLDVDGSLYKHRGQGIREALGHLLHQPDGCWWNLLSETEREEHWRSFADLREKPSQMVCPEEMVYIPPGLFMMGSTQMKREQPVHPVYVDGFFLDKYAVTTQKYADFLNAVPDGNIGLWLNLDAKDCLIEKKEGEFSPKPGFENYPMVQVSWYGAAAYAQWAGKRLPTEAEWEKAALGGYNGRLYAWGDEAPDGQCNWLHYEGQYRELRPGFYHNRGPLPVGMFPPNSYGLYDMTGNVWEWCSDWYADDTYTSHLRINPQGPEQGERKILRGGAWSFDAENLRIANRSFAWPQQGYSYDGFRCAISNIECLMSNKGTGS